ncbi:uncharacterized protein ppp1r3ab isoform X2 [Corythoichthys intestinalis]|uniref:uncharacterized protein ppp1r3ab isoform X2 n=1 Tax=Corythoichthys intestinalis TaxID=161448 RepID=UPI0025A50BF9|nr:uncharacterized protein ppp1r3ab isoform X2 [Corythoichthys intestinalis]
MPRQRRRHHLPVHSLQSSAPMESEGQTRLPMACRLHVPGPDVDEDEGEVVISIRPKCSPLPRRRNSFSDEEESGPEFTPSGSRRVSFADAKGLSLVHVKEFDLWDVPKPPGMESLEGDRISTEEYSLAPLTFQLPLSPEDLLVRVQEQKIELESLELIPGTTTLKGLICVLNMSFHKAVYVRTTLDSWASHFDLLTEYISTSDDAYTDRFSFKLTLVPPFQEQGSQVDFCLRYETPMGTFWANNNNRNYVLLCQQRAKEEEANHEKQNVQKKSCLKSVSQIFVEDTLETSPQGNMSEDVPTTEDEVKQALQPDQSKEDCKNLQVENRQNCNRRTQRKAARMARVRDYFSQRGGLGDESDASRLEEIPGGDQAAVQSLSEQKPKLGDFGVITEKTLSEMPSRQDETRAHNEPQTPEEISLPSLMQGDTSAHMSNDRPPPTERFNTFISKGEEKTESCRNQSNGITFEPMVASLYHHLLGRTEDDWTCPEQAEEQDNSIGHRVQENFIGNKEDVTPLSTFHNLDSNDVKQQANFDRVAGSKTEDSVTKSVENTQNHEEMLENSTKDNSPIGTEMSLNVLKSDTALTSWSSKTVQSQSEPISEDHHANASQWETADWSDTEDKQIGTQGHQQQENEINNLTEECCDSNFNISLPVDNIWSFEAQTNLNMKEMNADLDSPSEDSLCLSFEPVTIQVPTCPPIHLSAGGIQNNVTLLSTFQNLSSEEVKHLTNLEFAELSDSDYSLVGSKSISPAEALNSPKDSNYSANDGHERNELVRKPHDFVETQEETCIRDDKMHHVHEDEDELKTKVLTCDNHSQVVSFFVAEANTLQEVLQEPISSAEIDKVQNWEAMLEEENVLEEEPEDIQNCPGIEELDNLKEEIVGMKTPTVEEPPLNKTVSGVEEHFEEMREGKRKVEVTEEEGTNENAVCKGLGEDERDVDKRNNDKYVPVDGAEDKDDSVDQWKNDKYLPVDGAEDKDDIKRWQFHQNEPKDEPFTHLREATEPRQDPSAQFPDESALHEEDEYNNRLSTEPESDASADSDSDDEVELHMHCLRVVQTKDKSAELAFSLTKRPSLSRSKPLSSPMPSISEALDEERGGCLQEGDTQVEEASQPTPSEPEIIDRNVARWRGTCTRSCVSKTLFYATLLAVFVVTAYYYDFLACFGLYLISVVWLLCQGEKQPIKDNSIG